MALAHEIAALSGDHCRSSLRAMIRMDARRRPRSDEMTKETQAAIHQEVERYLRTGNHDTHYSALSGHSFLERARVMDRAMREALLAEVRRREKCRPLPSGPGG